jgi:glucosamine--fructose-6-phosphate aminotransferase (isomerizing)
MPASPAMPAVSRTLMFQEAREGPAAVARMIKANREAMVRIGQRLRNHEVRAVVTCARGSSDSAATFGRYLLETRVGMLTSSIGLSVESVYDASPSLAGVLYLAISQSGMSPDLLASAARARRDGAFVVAMVNSPASPLAELADEVIDLRAGTEHSVAATKSYLSSLAALAMLTAHWTDDAILLAAVDALPDLLAQAVELDWSSALSELAPANNLYVLGRGHGLGIAQEAALKLKETCALHAEAFSAAEVLHGPMALVTSDFPVVVFVQDDATRANTMGVAKRFAGFGANVLIAGATVPGTRQLPTLAAHAVIEPILAIQSFYPMVAALSLARDRDPDSPPHLRKVTETL